MTAQFGLFSFEFFQRSFGLLIASRGSFPKDLLPLRGVAIESLFLRIVRIGKQLRKRINRPLIVCPGNPAKRGIRRRFRYSPLPAVEQHIERFLMPRGSGPAERAGRKRAYHVLSAEAVLK